MASVRKREWTYKGEAKTAWVVNYTDQAGNRRQQTFGKKKDADAARLKIEMEIEQGVHTAASQSVSVNEAADHFIGHLERRHRLGDKMTGKTLASRRSGLEKIKAHCGKLKVDDVTTDVAQAWIDEMVETLANSSVRSYYSTLILLLDFCVKRRWVKRNKLRDDRPALPPWERKTDCPSKDEIRQILESTDTSKFRRGGNRHERNRRALAALGLFAGLRIGEVGGLQWESVDFKNKVIRVKHSQSQYDGLKGPKSEAGNRNIPMSPIVFDALWSLYVFWTLRQRFMKIAPAGKEMRWFIDNHLEWALRRGEEPTDDDEPISGYVFRRGLFFGPEWNRPMTGSNLDKHWEVVMLEAGIVRPDGKRKYTFHAMRHGAASLFIDSQLPAMNLKTVIGHASVSTTYDVYGHMFPDDERTKDAAISIANQFGATTEQQDARTT